MKLAVGNENEETSLVEDPATGKSFTFRKRKGKPVDFLDVLIQTEVTKHISLKNLFSLFKMRWETELLLIYLLCYCIS